MDSTGRTKSNRTLLLGVGNSLLTDDGIGIHVLSAIQGDTAVSGTLRLHDGGTIGLALLPEIEDCDALIAVDAMELDEVPGTLRVFEGQAMDVALAGKKRTAHEVALSDLMEAAELIGRKPVRRALIGIQPLSTLWGLEPTPDVSAAIPAACSAIGKLLEDWHHDHA